ncbi:MAG: F0F1 ATP synthase subunit epsilon [Zetaproteobacteria bacterium CG12_big_fil_rev_8_21_14_0_65_54_13]|nr:MAG: F0F1 ATP synthase subunit epsilon [Zetaproteobacteria bacterium CG12_big_fil_rev_8_21_14_0_65_54_13]PIX54774.1 MAG: F0F1 ATP synthase subunit epsilon [Zetaproteobacteria bacterium CG_4_10_14_3_um_filter_54_28]PJA29670.1 MAG: F0F1 ATP synthase subunit epsilon [Zetaproteobacteria bacterium CG_4_9_14_3_um_filter_54_145]
MNLKILLPFKVFTNKRDVLRMVAVTYEGSFGLLPHRLDCVASLSAGILVYETAAEGEVYIAVDEGVLVKTGSDVRVSVRNAIGGMSLDKLRAAVETEFMQLGEQEQKVRSVLAKMESGFIRRLAEFHHG